MKIIIVNSVIIDFGDGQVQEARHIIGPHEIDSIGAICRAFLENLLEDVEMADAIVEMEERMRNTIFHSPDTSNPERN